MTRPTAGNVTRLEAYVERAAPEVLGVSVLLQPPTASDGDAITLRFSGRRLTGEHPGPDDTFAYEETIANLVPRRGLMTITTKIRDVPPGRWVVRTEMLAAARPADARIRRPRRMHRPARSVAHASWSWRRWRPADAGPEPIQTCLAPFVRTPGVLIGSWPGFVLLGVVSALIVQHLLIRRIGFDGAHVLTVSLASLLVGAAAAKVWFVLLHRSDRRRDGWAVQGLVAGIALSAPTLLLVLHVPVGGYLDATAPALMIGLGVGRLGCFLTGCCAGRLTESRWGIWSSNRRIGARRLPAQLLESGLALAVASAAWALVGVAPRHGMVFVGSLAAYTLVRQVVLTLREEPRKSPRASLLIGLLAGLALLADVAWAAVLG